MAGLSSSEVRSSLNVQTRPSPTSPRWYRTNALIDVLNRLDDLDVFHVEAWTNQPYRLFVSRMAKSP
jgi:hypothetical protein